MPPYTARSALIVVDVQNDFASPQGSLYVNGGEEVIPFINDQVEQALDSGALVVFTQDWHPSSTPHFQKDGGIWPVHCVADTPGAAFHAALRVVGPVVRKGTGGEDGYSGFTVADPKTGQRSATELESLLAGADIEEVVVVGLATDYCVLATALDAASSGRRVTVLRDGIRAVDLKPGDGARALEKLEAAGVHVE